MSVLQNYLVSKLEMLHKRKTEPYEKQIFILIGGGVDLNIFVDKPCCRNWIN